MLIETLSVTGLWNNKTKNFPYIVCAINNGDLPGIGNDVFAGAVLTVSASGRV